GLAGLATCVSLMAVFVPIGFMGGIVGRFMSSFGLTASFAIGVSLIVSFTLTPMLAARLIKRKEPETKGAKEESHEAEKIKLTGDGMIEASHYEEQITNQKTEESEQ